MHGWKSSLAGLLLAGTVASATQAQQKDPIGYRYTGYPGGYSTYGIEGGVYGISTGFGTYGLPGTYPNYAGHALSGYGPGTTMNSYFAPTVRAQAAQTQNNLGKMTRTVAQPTARPKTPGSKPKPGVTTRGGGGGGKKP